MDFSGFNKPITWEQPRTPDIGDAAQQASKKPGGLRGALLNFLPVATSAVGAVAGTALGPLGTAAGGAVGGGLGEYLRAKLSGEDASFGNIARETGFGALGGAGKLIKSGKAAIDSGRAANGLRGVLTQEGRLAKTRESVLANGRMIAGLDAAPAPAATRQSTEAAMQARKGIVGKTKDSAAIASQKGFGVEVGQSTGRGKVRTPEQADDLSTFITQGSQRYGGIRAGKPIDQAKDAQTVFNNVTMSLDDTLKSIDRPTQPAEIANIVANAAAKISDNAGVVGTTKTLDKFKAKIEKAKSLSDLEKVRREADDLAFTSTGAGKTSAAAQSHAVRDAIDEFITPLSADYKAIKGDYTLARDALEATSKASKNAKGFPVPFTNGTVTVGDQAISGVKNKVAARVSGAQSAPDTGATGGFRPFMGQVAKASVPQVGARAAGSLLFGMPFVGGAQPDQPDAQQIPTPVTPPTQQPDMAMQTPAGGAFSDSSRVEQAYMEALANGDTQTAAAILKGYETFGKQSGTAPKPLSAEASKVIANANSGLSSLDQLEQMIQQDPAALQKTIIPGRSMFGGAIGNAAGTAGYDTAARNVADVITRLRTGAALTESEERFYKSQLPQAFDSPEVIQQKLKMFRDLFSSVGNRTGSAGTDMQQQVGL